MDKLCKDCKHSTPRYAGIRLCLHEKNMVVSKMDGEREIDRGCQSARDSSSSCGMNAAWFEAK